MSVILFHKSGVYQTMANVFEDLKHVLKYRSWGDGRFYTALRRLYFANVATFLCQYHDDSPLGEAELAAIDTFMELEGKRNPRRSLAESAEAFVSAWSSLKYNLITNDGEHYKAEDSYEFIEQLALTFCHEAMKQLPTAAA
jgi:hypothetical protein